MKHQVRPHMDIEVMRLRDMLTVKFAELVYNGFRFSPEMECLMVPIDKSQEFINGEVTLKLYQSWTVSKWNGCCVNVGKSWY